MYHFYDDMMYVTPPSRG